MKRETEARGINLSMLLRKIVEKHYGVKPGRPAKRLFPR
jgi:hypothetical protein